MESLVEYQKNHPWDRTIPLSEWQENNRKAWIKEGLKEAKDLNNPSYYIESIDIIIRILGEMR
jgi:hypothetical protein